MRYKLIALILGSCIIFVALSLAQDKPGFNLLGDKKKQDFNLIGDKEKTTVTLVSTPANAVAYALADIANVPETDRPFQRYIWIQDAHKDKIAAIKYMLNEVVSRASVIIYPKVIAKGQLIRVDLRILAPRKNDIAQLLKTWEKFNLDPYFHIIKLGKDALPADAVVIKSEKADPPGSTRFKSGKDTWYLSPAGNTYILSGGKWSKKSFKFKDQKISAPGAHTGLAQATMLRGLMQTSVPIVSHQYFIVKSTTTLGGGLYYEFIGIERNPDGKTAQEAFLEKLGASEERVAKLRSDQRAALFKSGVSGRPRRIDVFQGEGVRPDSGTGLITITHDIGEDQTDPAQDPIRNLLEFQDKARELIAERPNGLHYYALFDGDGGLQDSAPDDVVKDHTIPAPYPARLQPGISCIRCHGPPEGLQPFKNEVKLMLAGLLDVFDDLSSKNKNIPDTLERLAGLYSGDLAKPIRRGRNDYSDAVFKATGGYSVPKAAQAVSDIYGNYYYKDVDCYTALLELGYDVPKSKAVAYFNVFIPPLQPDVLGISPEDPMIGALRVGLKINRYQWEQIYADAAFRAMQARQKKIKGQKK